MAKKHLYYSEAERMFVVEQKTLEEIASRTQTNEKTIRKWKAEGDWDTKRKQYLKCKQLFHEELYDFARKLMNGIKDDIDNGEKVDTGRMYAFIRMLPMILKVKEYEDVKTKREGKKEKGLTPEIVELIEKEVLGINRG